MGQRLVDEAIARIGVRQLPAEGEVGGVGGCELLPTGSGVRRVAGLQPRVARLQQEVGAARIVRRQLRQSLAVTPRGLARMMLREGEIPLCDSWQRIGGLGRGGGGVSGGGGLELPGSLQEVPVDQASRCPAVLAGGAPELVEQSGRRSVVLVGFPQTVQGNAFRRIRREHRLVPVGQLAGAVVTREW